MKKSLYYYFIIIFFFTLTLQAKEDTIIINAFYGGDIDKVRYKDAKTAMELWIKKLADKVGVRSKLLFYRNFSKLKQDIEYQKIDTLILSSYSYLTYLHFCKQNFYQGWIKEEKDGKPFFRYLLLSTKKIKIKDEYKVDYYQYSNISKTIAQIYGWEHKKNFIFQKTSKESKPTLDLFFNKCDYAIVKEERWKLMQELNPQLTQTIKIIYTTPRIFVDIISLFSNHLSQKNRNIYYKSLNSLNTTSEGKQLMRLFKFNGLIRFRENQLYPLERYYAKYLKLKAKYAH